MSEFHFSSSKRKQTNTEEKTMIDSYILGLTLFASALRKLRLYKKIHCLQYEDLFWNVNYKNREPSWVFKKQSLMETADIQEISSIWKNKKQ